MKLLHQIPLLRPFLSFLIGIIIAININLQPSPYFFISILTFILLFLGFHNFTSYFNHKYSQRWVYGLLTSVFFLIFGYYITILNRSINNPLHFSKYTSSHIYIAKINSQPFEKEKTYKFTINIEKTFYNNNWIKTIGNSIIYVAKDSLSKNLNFGDIVILNANLKEILSPRNPHVFDYKKYIAYQNIWHQAFINHHQWKLLKVNNTFSIIRWSQNIREKVLKLLVKNNFKNGEYAVAASLLLGNTHNLDIDIIQDYRNAGVIHILVVSGLHVSIIYLLISRLLFFLYNRRFEKIIKAIIILIILWIYVIITGCSPSVLRASIMFSFIIIGKTFSQNHNTLNNIIASAFLLLLINPFNLMNISFQLSYLAVIGIVVVNQHLQTFEDKDNFFKRKILPLIILTLSAQAFVYPLCIYYFHQFPVYFLLANIIVIPLTGVIINLIIALIFVQPFTLLAKIISFISIYLIKSMNAIIHYIDNLPYSLINNIYINIAETIVLYIITIVFLFFIIAKVRYSLITFLCLLSLFITERTYKKYTQAYQKIFIVYHQPKSSIFEFIYGHRSILFADSNITNKPKELKKIITGNHAYHGIINEDIFNINSPKNSEQFQKNLFLYKYSNFCFFNNKIFLRIDKTNCYNIYKNKLAIDYIIISQNPNISIRQLQQAYIFKNIIIDSSNSIKYTLRLIKEAKQQNINYYSVAISGAYVLNM
jgi:competence protein ComEC